MALVVFTGGARSGKSSAAANLAAARQSDGAHVHVAVFGREGVDGEFDGRIATHREQRPAQWSVCEVDDPLAGLPSPSPGDLLVVDCLGTAVGRIMEIEYARFADSDLGVAEDRVLPTGYAPRVEEAVDRFTRLLRDRDHDLIVVTNEVGSGVVPVFATGRLFQDVLGRANRTLLGAADASYLCVAGRLIGLQDLPTQATWPRD